MKLSKKIFLILLNLTALVGIAWVYGIQFTKGFSSSEKTLINYTAAFSLICFILTIINYSVKRKHHGEFNVFRVFFILFLFLFFYTLILLVLPKSNL